VNTVEPARIERGMEVLVGRVARDDRLAVRIYLRKRVTARKWKVIAREFGVTYWAAQALARRGKVIVEHVIDSGYDRDRMERDLAEVRPNFRRQVPGYDGAEPSPLERFRRAEDQGRFARKK
jgi:hypothetical protein